MAVPAQISMTNGFNIGPVSAVGRSRDLASGGPSGCSVPSILEGASKLLLNSSSNASTVSQSQEFVLRAGQFWYV
jgi:hypothetical protein